jgi:hypothetical protein
LKEDEKKDDPWGANKVEQPHEPGWITVTERPDRREK